VGLVWFAVDGLVFVLVCRDVECLVWFAVDGLVIKLVEFLFNLVLGFMMSLLESICMRDECILLNLYVLPDSGRIDIWDLFMLYFFGVYFLLLLLRFVLSFDWF